MDNVTPSPGFGAITALLLVIACSVWLGTVAQKVISRGSFLSSYFLGNRGLGVWTMALTATVQSGGTFMGFPSLVYSHGWTVALWIGSYMIVPLTGFAVLGKRLAQISRRTGAITVPDLFGGRFNDRRVALVASLLILFFLTFMMIAQFKAGGLIMKISWPESATLALVDDTASAGDIDYKYQVGLIIFALTVVGYTLIGGFLASVWTDLFQSVLMFLGVVGLLFLTFSDPAVGSLEQATRSAVAQTNENYISFAGYAKDGRSFLTPALSISFFFVWIFGGMASPASISRVMASKDTGTLRRSIVVLATYNGLIYVPLICICMASRVIYPDVANSDEIIPRMALWATRDLPIGSFWAGLILAAPFGAVMATVSSYLVVISSGVVHDIYQRFFRPEATENELKRATYLIMVLLGIICWLANVQPVQYLQALVVFCTSGGAASFLVPAIMSAYWRRANYQGALSAMLAGAGTVLTLFVIGLFSNDPMIGQATRFRPYFLGGCEPVVWGILMSAVFGVLVTLMTPPPDEHHVERMFA
jgi:SSS family solute:Na+ symporter/sodium/pantothenate symporter